MTHILETEDMPNKERLVLAMLGHLMPEAFAVAARCRIDRAGMLEGFSTAAEAREAMRSMAGANPAVTEPFTEAEEAHAWAEELLAQKRYPEAMEAAAAAHKATVTAYCAAQSPQPDEFRGFWCHNPAGVLGMGWETAIERLAEAGFTAVFPNMLWGGSAAYPSEVLPLATDLKEGDDLLTECLAACKKHGLECHVWKVNWRLWHTTPEVLARRLEREGRTQVTFNGDLADGWLCPSHPANQQLEIDAMVEVATRYKVDGIHFDYIRYSGRDHCFCEGCRKRFELFVGRRLDNWPEAVRSDPELAARWVDFRCANITRVVSEVSRRVRQARPEVEISAAVFPNCSTNRVQIGQDWRLWCEKGYLDFVCPMDYTPYPAQFEDMVRRQRTWAGSIPVYPGIGLSTWADPSDVVRLVQHITKARGLRTGGFMVFNYGPSEATEILPLLASGITRNLSAKQKSSAQSETPQ